MSELTLWRFVAVVACVGWAVTAGSTLSAPGGPAPVVVHTAQVPNPEPDGLVERRRAIRAALAERIERAPREDAEPALRERIRAEVEAELEEERRERHARRREQHLDRQLEQVAAFARTYELQDVQGELEQAVLDLHDRMEALGPPPGPPGPDGPPVEVRERMDDAFQVHLDQVSEVLDDELASTFLEWTRPGPPRRPEERIGLP